jgi:RNA polymerase sigma-70 factor (ECF subfamily)
VIEDVYRREWAGVVATLAHTFGLDVAEEATAEAFAVAVARWPVDGVPDRPGAWLTTTARRKALDRVRRESTRPARQAAAHELAALRTGDGDGSADSVGDAVAEADSGESGPIPDDRLRLVFTCCHPALSLEAQVALSLRLLCGLTTVEIARAFLVPERTMTQRLFRAKQKIAHAGIPYRVPAAADLPARTAAVLRVVYLVFREGYAPTGSDDLVRADLRDEAVRLARLLAELLPDDGEVLGLLALLLLHDSRRATRADDAGELVLLADQDRRRWDHAAIREGLGLVRTALTRSRGPYALQAAIAACHAAAPSAADTDWSTIARLYDELARIDPGPAVVLNRAVAVAEVDGPAAGLAMLDSLASTPAGERLAKTSHLLHGARADLLRRLDRLADAQAAYRRAADLATTPAERRFYQRHLTDLDQTRAGGGASPE